MQFIFDNIGWIIFIGFIVMSFIFNSVGTVLKNAAKAAERSRDYQNPQPRTNPLGGESAEDFFNKMQTKKAPAQKKLRLNPKHQEIVPEPAPEPKSEEPYEFKAPDRDNVESIPKTTKKSTSIQHRINPKDRKTLRKAIVINEVLGRPKAFKH